MSRAGDVWALGPHRLICGDAADANVVAALMQGERARLDLYGGAERFSL